MKTGDILLIPFPYAELTNRKIRPAVVIAVTKDKYKDIIVSAISSVVPDKITENEIILEPTAINNLRATDVELALFKRKFKNPPKFLISSF